MPITQLRMLALLDAVGDFERGLTELVNVIQKSYKSARNRSDLLVFDNFNSSKDPNHRFDHLSKVELIESLLRAAELRDIWQSELDTIAAGAVHHFLLRNPIQSTRTITEERKHFNDNARRNVRSAKKQRERRRRDGIPEARVYTEILQSPRPPNIIQDRAPDLAIKLSPGRKERERREGGLTPDIKSEIMQFIENEDALQRQLAKMREEENLSNLDNLPLETIPAPTNPKASQVALDDLKRMDEEDDELGEALLGESNLGVGGKRGG